VLRNCTCHLNEVFGILAMDVGDENAVAVLNLIVKTVVKVGIMVCYPPFQARSYPRETSYLHQ
jgi:hypothetical protein